ncbi:1-acyl-sn-glycerol-3-phosphate acyltransferase [Candidatus Woesearchaeota archaeon]|nr:1-acyl-sn-glycerol-3-phosphate acyltransferase [Candidatus Woesearchaeota archaeon]
MPDYFNPAFQKCIRKIADFGFSSYFGIQVHGKDNVPKAGAAIFSFNHVHMLDSFIIGAKEPRISYAISKKEHFYPVLRSALRGVGALPVNTKPEKHRFTELTTNYGLLIPKRNHQAFLEEINSYLSEEEKLQDLSTLDYKLMSKYAMGKGEGLLSHLPGTRTNSYENIAKPKKGTARLALQMQQEEGIIVSIIPGAIVYSKDNKPIITRKPLPPYKTRADISFGKPLTAARQHQLYKQEPEAAVQQLTDIINEEVNNEVKNILRSLTPSRP